MKRRLMMAALLVLCMAFSCAAAQTLPNNDVFSPGLIRVSEKLAQGEMVTANAQLQVTDMLYVRDVSLLQKMLKGMQLSYTGGGTLASGIDALTLTREDETLFSAQMIRNAQGAELTLNGRTLGVDLSAYGDALSGGDWLAGTAILERAPLTQVCALIEGLDTGDALPGGFAVTQGFTAERTMSDDGARLTKINIAGEIARAGEAPWQVSGYLRQPAGRTPKDTFEITFAQDEDNTLTFTYSSQRSYSDASKGRRGQANVTTSLVQEGKLDGYRVTTRLSVTLKNAWTADGENLQEKVTASVSLGHTDRRPGKRMQRLNDMSAKLRCVLTLETAESGSDVIAIGEETTLTATFDGNPFLDVAVNGSASVGGSCEAAALTGAPAAAQEEISAAFEEAAVSMAKKLYAQLDEDAREMIEKGL